MTTRNEQNKGAFKLWAAQNPRVANAVRLVVKEDFFAEHDRQPTQEELESLLDNANLYELAEFIRQENKLDAEWALREVAKGSPPRNR